MHVDDFVDFGKAAVDFLANYTENLRDRDVLPSIEPGYLIKLLPDEAPEEPQSWQDVLEDVEKIILPAITHWNSPNFHAYFPAGNSYPGIVGEMICAGLNCIGLSWIASPACTELEVVTMDWLGKMLNLPKEFLNSTEGPGGGVIQGSASESILICLLTAKERTTQRIKNLHPDWDESLIKSKLVAYTSDQSNSSVEKTGLLGSMRMRLLPTDDNCSLRGNTVLEAVKKDIADGLIPCYVVATLGTTPTCAFDNLDELGPICKEYNMWLHIDAAYAGAAFVCPEFRYLMSGVEYADSFNFNAHKWMLVNIDCSAMWVKDARPMIEAFYVDRIYLADEEKNLAPDYRHWQISLGRRFRSLKLWFVLRIYGVEGIRKHIRHTLNLIEIFENHVKSDDRFEVVSKSSMGLICFRIKGSSQLTKDLLAKLNERKKLYLIAGAYKDIFLLRFVVGSRMCQEEDIHFAWNEIREITTEILKCTDEKILTEPTKQSGEKYITSEIHNLNPKTKNIPPKIS